MLPFLQRPRLRIAVLCTANICRSPAAQALLTDHLRRAGLSGVVRVDSAGTAVAAPGAPADPRMRVLGAARGLRFRRRGARAVDATLVKGSDIIWVMENHHLEVLLAQYPEAGERSALLDPEGAEIEDPFFGDRAGVRRIFERLDDVCARRVHEIALRLEQGAGL